MGVHRASSIGPNDFSYHGGQVMHNNITYTIFWQPSGYSFGSNPSGYESTINQFLTDVAHDSGSHSNVYATDPQYYDTVGGGHHYANYNSSFAGSVVDTNGFPASGCSDPSAPSSLCLNQVQEMTEVFNVAQAHGWPLGDTSVEYFLVTPQNVASCTGDGSSNANCAYAQYCAYHSAIGLSNGTRMIWANIPWVSGISTCDDGYRPNGSDADPALSHLSHEHNESITDPFGDAWYDSSGNENGDKCAWNFGSGSPNQSIDGHSYMLQEEWDNSTSSCVQTFTPPTPTISSLSPAFGSPGDTITINGTGFISPSDVKFNGTSASSFTIVSATQLTAEPATGTTSGPITVVTPAGTATSPANFTMAPTITAFSPTAGPVGTNVTIRGTDLIGATSVKFGGVAATFVALSNTQISATVPAGALTGAISVTTPGGTVASSTNYTVSQIPTVTGFNPTSGPAGTNVTVYGTNFMSGVTSVTFNGFSVPGFTIFSDTTLVVPVPVGATSGSIAVSTLAGTGTSTGTFTVIPAPTVSGFTPTTGAAGASVTITGTGLTGATNVTFNGTPAASYTVDSDTQITAVVAAGTTSGPVAVTTLGGTATSTGSFTFIPAPTISDFTPTTAAIGASVTITGTGFTGATAVAFAGTPAATFSVDSDSQITATVNGGTASGTISITTPGGTVTSSGSFTVIPIPTIASFSPTSGAIGATVTITGTGLTGATAVTFGGTNAASFGVDSDTQITATVAAGSSTGFVAVTTPGGTSTSADSFTVIPAPTITGFTPATGPAGTRVTITGTNFTGASAVQFTGTNAASFTVNSDTQITATVPSNAITGRLTVTTPGGTATSSGSFTIIATPVVSGFSPSYGPPGTSVTISGSGLSGATAVKFNGTDAASFTVVSASQITAVVAAAATSGTISVTTPGGTATSGGSFTVVPPPTITGFSPTSGPVGASVTITGTNLSTATSVSIAGTPAASFTADSDTQVTAVVATGTPQVGGITVVTHGGTAYSTGAFTVIQPPTVTGFSPTSGGAGSSVTISGTNLTGATAVKFNGTDAASYTVNSATQITAVVAGGTTSGTISVTTAAGTGTSSGSFTFVQAPTIAGFTPASGPVGTSVTITGTNLTGATSVKFNGKSAASFTVDSLTQITAVVASGTTSGTVSVTTAGGTATSSGSFSVIPAPIVSGFTPTSGPVGTSVAISGTNLDGASAVKFNGADAASFTVDSDTQITAVVAGGTTSGVVTVATPGGTVTSSGSFTVIQPPTISGFSPTSGAVGASVTITGTNLSGANAVSFNGTPASSYTVDSATQITAAVAPGTTSGTISVTTVAGTATSTDSFTVIPAPTVSGFTPTSGPAGTAVTITGSNLSGATAVTFGGTDASSFTVDSSTQITATVGGGSSGTISVATPGGTATSTGTFTVIAAPAVSGFAPTSGPVGTTVTIAGTALSGASAVTFGGTPAASFTVDSPTQITAVVANGTSSGVVAVTTPGGTATSSGSFTVILPPTVSGFTPASGIVGTSVTISGTSLSGATAVTFGGAPATSYTVNSATQITALVPNGAATGTIAVTTAGGSATSTGTFTVIPTPVVSGFSPTSGPVGTSVTISGSGLGGSTAVTFNGTAAASFSVDSPTQITAVVAAGTTTGKVAVTTPGGTVTSSGSFTVVQPPTISLVSPTYGPIGTSVTIQGTSLGGATAVAFNGTPAASFTVNSSTQITAVVASGTTSGTVSVTTAAGTATSTQSFTVELPPTITSFSPTKTGAGNVVTIYGTNLADTQSVTIGGVPAGQIAPSATQISVVVGSGATGSIRVTTPGGTVTSSQTFTFVPAPTISGFTPTSGPAGTSVTITGTDLDTATSVKFNGTAATFAADSSTQITATVPAGATSGTIAVATLGGTVTSSGSFTVIAAPGITGFTPTSGIVGTSVTISGANLSGATAVQFNGTPASSYTVDSPTQITAVVASGTTTGKVSVTTPGGTVTSSASFTVIQAPTISGFTPTTARVGATVTINGTSLSGATAVAFNGTPAASYSVLGPTQITAVVASGTTSGTISVTTAAGTATSTDSFTVDNSPIVSSFSPTSGAVGASVTITGSGFDGVTAVAFNGTGAADFTLVSSTQITATVAPGTTSGPVSVTTLGGTGASSGSFTVIAAPTITSISPTAGQIGTTVVISGTNLAGATAVSFNGTPASSFTVGSPTWIDATVAPGTTTGHVVVTTPGGSVTSTDTFTVVAAPAISGISPDIGPTGATVTISGSGLANATAVKFNGTPASAYTVDSDAQITATVAFGTTSGHVTVTTAGGTAVSGEPFTVVSAPFISTFTPRTVTAGTTVTITGQYLTGATAVQFNGTDAQSYTIVSDSQIDAVVAAGTTSGQVTVTTAGGTATASGTFTYVVVPTITSFSPTIAPIYSNVTITGSGFTGATGVSFNGTPAGYSIDSDTQITATVEHGSTTGPISITTPAGTGTSSDSFVVATVPTITSFSPTSGTAGDTVTIDGSGFSGASDVSIDGTPVASYHVVSDAQLTAVVASGTNSGPIVISSPGGTGYSSSNFTVVVPPTITSISPTSGPVGATIQINGSGLAGATAVSIGGTPASFTQFSDTLLAATVAPGTTSGKVVVTTPNGTATSTDDFTVVPAPTLTGFSPASGPVGTSVTLTGTHLTGATAVAIGGVAATFAVNSDTQVTATVPSGTSGGAVTVTTPGGTALAPGTFTVTANPPQIQFFTPSAGETGSTITIGGSHLTGATAVAFGGQPAVSFTVLNDSAIQATVGAGATGQVTVTGPGGTATSTGTFTYYSAPSITSFAPSSGDTGSSVTITGAGFTGAEQVDFDYSPATYTVDSDTEITATVPAAAGSGVIEVVGPAGYAVSVDSFTVTNPAPVVSSFAPTSGIVGTPVVISGSHLSGATAVQFGGTDAASFNVLSDSSISAVVAAGTTSGLVSVTTAGGTASSAGSFTVLNPPAVDSFAPTSGRAGDPVTITGSSFTGATSVSFGAAAATSFTVDSPTQITATVPDGATSGPISVVTPDGTDASADSFTVFTSPAPVVQSFSPTVGKVGTLVTIAGSSLAGATSVSFNGTPAIPLGTSSTTITVDVPAGATSGKIDVTTPTGGTGESAGTFWLRASIASFTPDGGPDGTLVTILGSGFDDATAVKFNTTKASDFTVVNDGKITATVAPGTTTGYITVVTPAGSAKSLTKYAADAITGFSPAMGPPGTHVTIYGAGLLGATAVKFHGTPASKFTISSNTKIVAVVADGTTSGPVTVTTPAGTMTSAASFGVPAHVDSFAPDTAPAGTTVTITGSGFVGATAVKFNTTAATNVDVVSDSKITAKIADGTTSGYVKVLTPGGTAKSQTPLTIVRVGSFSPTHGLPGTTVTILGSGFTGATAVRFHGLAARSFTVKSDTKITAVVDDGTTTGAIAVVTPNGTVASDASFGIVPKIETFAPTEAPVGTAVTIDGSGFDGATAVKINGKQLDGVSVVSDTKITGTIAEGTTSGAVKVVTPGGTAMSSTPLKIVSVTGLLPAHGSVGTTVTITGTGLSNATAVRFNGTPAASIKPVSDTTLKAVVADGTTSGTVSVDTPYGTATSVAPFGIVPKIDGVDPEQARIGTSVTITGSGFDGATAAKINGTPLDNLSVASDSKITGTVADGTTSGYVKVVTPGGIATSSTKVTVVSVASFTPSVAHVGATVTITGSGLKDATAVRFGATNAASFSIVSGAEITAVVAAGTTTGPVSVDTPAGTVESSASFGVKAKVVSFAPAGGPAGTTVTVTGSGFTDASDVTVGGKAAGDVTVVDDSTLTFTVPDDAVSGAIAVRTGGGTASSTQTFSFLTITSVSPGSVTPGTTVKILGSGFTGATSVQFDGVDATSFKVVSDTKITAVVPTDATSGAVTVSTANGQAASADPVTVGGSSATQGDPVRLYPWSLLLWGR